MKWISERMGLVLRAHPNLRFQEAGILRRMQGEEDAKQEGWCPASNVCEAAEQLEVPLAGHGKQPSM